MKKTVQFESIPAICIPITGDTKQSIAAQLKEILRLSPDVIEWRADFFRNLADEKQVLEIIAEIKKQTEIPLLFTIRSVDEGGEKTNLSKWEIVQLLTSVCREGNIDILDYETSNKEEYVKKIRQVSEENDIPLILSYHNFEETTMNEEILMIAKQAVKYGADIAKFALMPHSIDDVFRLLHLTKELDKLLEVPIITMSMGELGAMSRVMGWSYGSIMTFGIGAEASAPGQISALQLKEMIDTIKSSVQILETKVEINTST